MSVVRSASVEPGDDQHIALAGERQGGGKRPVCSGAAHRTPARTRQMEGVDLTICGLQIGPMPLETHYQPYRLRDRHVPPGCS